MFKGSENMIYLDYSATTPMNDEVLNTYVQISKNYWGNASSLHQFGAKANMLFEKAQEQALQLLNATDHQILFTSGATESSNLAIRGIAKQYKNRGNHIVTTVVEHSSVYETCKELEKEGYRVTYLKVNEQGMIDLEELRKSISKETILVSIMMVNAEVGTLFPIEKIGRIIKEVNPFTFFHSDIVQAFGKVEVDLDRFKIDLASLAAHKIYGPKGVGALVVRNRITLSPILFGGGQQEQNRPGTIDVASIVSMSKAMRLAVQNSSENYAKIKELNRVLYRELEKLSYLRLNSHEPSAIPHVINFSIQGVKAETVVHALAEQGVYISSKSACSSKSAKPSRVLQSIGCDDERASQSLRVSLSHLTKKEEIVSFLEIFKKIMDEVLVN